MLKASLFDYKKIIRFGFIGILSSATYALIFLALKNSYHLPIFSISAISFLAAIPISYFGNRWLTFKSYNKINAELPRFFGVQIINLICTSGLVDVVSNYFKLPTILEIMVAFIIAPIMSFILYEIWVYKQSIEIE